MAVPPRLMREFAFNLWVYRRSNLVERFLNRLERMRDPATRHDRRPDNFFAAIKRAAIRIWIDAYKSAASRKSAVLLFAFDRRKCRG